MMMTPNRRMIFHGIVSIFYLVNVRITVDAFTSVSSSSRIPARTTSFFVPNPNTHHHHRRNPNFGIKSTTLSSSFAIHDDTLHLALKKPSKTLSIILDCNLGQHDNNNKEEEDTNNMEQIVSLLSMQLRKVQASALHTSDVRIAEVLVSEQLTAKGNFPGPCPILYSGSHYDEAIRVGVTGIIGTYDELSKSQSSSTVQKICKVSSPKDVMTVLENSKGNTTPNQNNNNYFCVDGTLHTIQDIMDAIKSSGSVVVIASIPSMQEENQEIRLGKELQAMGVMSILMEGSCVGDNEDIEYASFVINGLTKKRSSKFNMSGLTGSTNGHFGGIASSTTTTWLRTKR